MSTSDRAWFSNQGVKEALQREIVSPAFGRLFQKLKSESKHLSPFSQQREFIEFMHNQELMESSLKEAILQEVFHHMKNNKHPLWDSFLSLIFWPALDHLFRRKIFWEPNHDPENFWCNLYHAFLETVRYLSARPLAPKLAFQIRMGTFSRLHDLYEKEWEWKKFKSTCSEAAAMQPQTTRPEEEMEQHLSQESLHRQYRACLRQGIISEPEFAVLVAIEIDDKDLKDFAAEINTGYESLKKRRQRAQSKVQNFFQKK